MNEKNLDFLKDKIKYSGFGEGLHAQLKENLSKAQTEFSLKHQVQYGKDELNSTLHFKKSTQSDMYFFNSYQASLKKQDGVTPVSQTFNINKEGGNITSKEAYNLLDGRAVNKDLISKEGKLYNAWQQLDFKETTATGNFKIKQFSQQYGFDLEKALAKHPIKEMGNQLDRSRLVDSLQKGNRQAVTFMENGAEQKRFIEANPQFKSVAVYDEKQQRIRQSADQKPQVESQSQQQSEKQGSKKQENKAQQSEEPSPKGKKKGMSVA